MSKEELLTHFVHVFGPREARKIVEDLIIERPELATIPPEFVENYLGELTPRTFEKETVKILKAIGLDVEYQPKLNGTSTEIEIFVLYGEHCGIIDTKYYQSGFPLSQNLSELYG